MSRLFIYLFILVFFISGCTDNSSPSIEEAIYSEVDDKYLSEIKAESPEKENISLEEYLSDPSVGNPVEMYFQNKENAAKTQVQNAYVQASITPGERFYYETQRLEQVRRHFIEGNYDRAISHAENLLNQSISPVTRSEVYFIMGDIHEERNQSSKALDYIDRAYETMKEIPEERHIMEQVESYKELLENFAEISDIDLSDYEDDDDDYE
ncbi:MAG: hypothetical protein ACQESP_06950 [Candidatus Muiribacteriota bacterium]